MKNTKTWVFNIMALITTCTMFFLLYRESGINEKLVDDKINLNDGLIVAVHKNALLEQKLEKYQNYSYKYMQIESDLKFFPMLETREVDLSGIAYVEKPFENIVAIEIQSGEVAFYFWHAFDKKARKFLSYRSAKTSLEIYKTRYYDWTKNCPHK